MEKWKLFLGVGLFELLFVGGLLAWYNLFPEGPFPSVVALVLCWFLGGSAVTFLGVSSVVYGLEKKRD